MNELIELARSMRTLIQASKGVWEWYAEEDGAAPNVEWSGFGCVAKFIAAVDALDDDRDDELDFGDGWGKAGQQ